MMRGPLRTAVLVVVAFIVASAPARADRLFTSGGIGPFTTASQSEWFSTGATVPRSDTSVIRTGSRYSIRVGGSGNTLTSGSRQAVGQRFVATSVDGTSYSVGCWFRVAQRPSASNTILYFGTSALSVSDFNLRLKSTGEIEVMEVAAVKATSAVLSLDTWYYLGYRHKRDAGSPNTTLDEVEFEIDEVDVYSNTAQAIASAPRELTIGGNLQGEAQTQGEWFFSNCAVNDSNTNHGGTHSGLPDNNRVVNYLFPNGAGNVCDVSPTGAATVHEALDEEGLDGDTSYALMATASADWTSSGNRCLVALGDASGSGIGSEDTIVLLGIEWVAQLAATSSQVWPGLRSGGSTVDVGGAASTIASSSQYWFIDDVTATNMPVWQLTNPVSAVAWTASDLDSLEIGFRGNDADDVKVSALRAIVEFVDNAPGVSGVPGGLFRGFGR